MPAPTPSVIPQPFAQAGDRNTIPDTSPDPQRAQYDLGFPPATMTPIDSGGKPMLGPDMNGILFDITAWLFALQGGQIQPYNSDTSDAIGGYGQGAIVAMVGTNGFWISTVNGNTSDPDAGGAGWQPVYAYGSTEISLTGGTYTLSAGEASRPFLIFSGTLLGNQQVEVPSAFRHWLVLNYCTGAFTLTVKTVAGTGVVIPAGGAASPTAIYCDGVNVNPVFVPSALPTSVAPVANTIPLRDNLGRAFELTAPSNTRTTQVATTEFANPLGDPTAGWRQNPDGTIEQWGSITKAANAQNRIVTFPVPFPNAVGSVQLTSTGGLSYLSSAWTQVLGPVSLTQFAINADDFGTTTPNPTVTVYWRAIGR